MLLLSSGKPARIAPATSAFTVSVARFRSMVRCVGRLGALGLLALAGLPGCSGDSVATYEPETESSQLYMALTLDYRAINLATAAPYNTIQLVATPRDGRDSVMNNLPPPTFRLASQGDTAVLQVTSEGLVTALGAAEHISVIAELVAPGPVRHADTALVNVTADPPPVLDSLSIEPASPESASWSMADDATAQLFGGFLPDFRLPPPLVAQVLDPRGQPVGGLLVEYVSLDPKRATMERFTGVPSPIRPGPVRVVARTWAYGVTKADTALYTVTWPRGVAVESEARIDGTRVFLPSEVRIVPGGAVAWIQHVDADVDITFDDPTQVADPTFGPPPVLLCFVFPSSCGAGNVLLPPMNPQSFVIGLRRFPVAGVYTYHSTHTGATGQIVVTNELPAGAGAP